MTSSDTQSDDRTEELNAWAIMPYWTSDEAAALLAGFDPGEASRFKETVDVIKIERLKKIIERSIEVGELAGEPTRINPFNLVTWTIFQPFHSEHLWWAVATNGRKDNLSQMTETGAPQPQANVEKRPLGDYERGTFLKILLGMAIEKYRYRPDERKGVAARIRDDLLKAGLEVDDDTIRSKLQEAVQRFGPIKAPRAR